MNLSDRNRRRYGLIGAVLIGLVMGMSGYRASMATLTELIVGIVAMALAMQIKVPPRAVGAFGLGIAITAATPIYFTRGDAVDLGASLAVVGLGAALGLVLGEIRRSGTDDRLLVFEMSGMGTYVIVFATVLPLTATQSIDTEWRVVVPLVAASALWFLILRVTARFERERYHDLDVLHRDFVDDISVFVSLVGTGALLALAQRRLGVWAVGVAGLPFIFAQSAFGRMFTIRRTYRQTIRALARIPEVAGLGVDGHADRTARLASEVGFDLSLSRSELEDLEYAALMHDIGRITLTEPAILRMGYTDDDIARWGSEIIGEAPYLHHVSELVRKLHEPYRKPGELSDPSVPLISKIVRAASSYDRLVHERRLSALQAIEVLHQGAAYDFDPSVIAALRRVLERRLAFHPANA